MIHILKEFWKNNLIPENKLDKQKLLNIRNLQIYNGENEYDLEFLEKYLEFFDMIHVVCPICTKYEKPQDHLRSSLGIDSTNTKKLLKILKNPHNLGIFLCFKRYYSLYKKHENLEQSIKDGTFLNLEDYVYQHLFELKFIECENIKCIDCSNHSIYVDEKEKNNKIIQYNRLYCSFFGLLLNYSTHSTKIFNCIGFNFKV